VAALRGLVAGPVVGVGSSSAGWTLLQLALREPDALDALSLVNPVLDASSLPDVAWLVAPSSRERAAQRFARRIPVLITHGLADAVVPAEQSRRFAERTGDDLEVQLVTPPSEGHSLGSAASAAEVARFEALLLGLASGRR
jgi:pimeloyl-ACP methyl ester carboxylesterase